MMISEPIQLNGVTITSDLLRALPHHLIIKYSVIPYQIEADSVHFFCADNGADFRAADELRFILDKRVVLTLIPAQMLREAVDKLDLASDGDIECASKRFKFRCMKRWHLLQRTEDFGVRFCETCEQRVYWANDWEMATKLGREGKCVAISDEASNGTLLGEMD